MRAKIWTDLLKLVLIFGVIWAALVWIPWHPDDAIPEFPIEHEEELGDMVLEQMLGDDPNCQPIENPVLDSAIWAIHHRLLDNLGLTEYDYNIIVVRREHVNAFALPGGHIVVHSGLIEFSENPEEVAAVLAHEMAYVEKRHVIDRLAKELGITVLFGALTGGDAVLLSEISRTVTSSYFSRRQEKEADDFALNLLHRCGISPRSLGTLFRRMNRSHEELELLMSHPATNSRIKASFEYELGKDFESRPFELNWDAVKRSLAESEEV